MVTLLKFLLSNYVYYRFFDWRRSWIIGNSTSYLCLQTYYGYYKKRVREELPKTEYVKIEKIVNSEKGKKTLPLYKAKAYDKTGNKIRDIDFEYEKSEYFYDGEKIYI